LLALLRAWAAEAETVATAMQGSRMRTFSLNTPKELSGNRCYRTPRG